LLRDLRRSDVFANEAYLRFAGTADVRRFLRRFVGSHFKPLPGIFRSGFLLKFLLLCCMEAVRPAQSTPAATLLFLGLALSFSSALCFGFSSFFFSSLLNHRCGNGFPNLHLHCAFRFRAPGFSATICVLVGIEREERSPSFTKSPDFLCRRNDAAGVDSPTAGICR
jgi:hypothetical protein